MIDVVFLLIIFFLVSSHLSRRETRMPVSLATALTGLNDVPDEASALTLTLDSKSRLYFGGTQVEFGVLANRLGELAGTNQAIRIRVDQTVPYSELQRVLGILTEAGVSDIAIVTNPSPGGHTNGGKR